MTDVARSEADVERGTFDIGDASGEGLATISFGQADRPVDLVFLHANGFNALTYRTLLQPLASGLHVLAVDQRGHGRTMLPTQPRGRRSWDDLADDIVALLDRLPEPVALAGHSLGGTVSCLAAARRPGKVTRLVLFDPVVMPWALSMALRFGLPPRNVANLRKLADGALRRKSAFPSKKDAVAAYSGRGAFRSWPSEPIVDYVADGFTETEEGLVALACGRDWEASNFLSQAHDSWGALRRLRCPAHILKAEKGSACALQRATAPNMQVDVVAGTSHFLPIERPEVARDALLASVLGARGGSPTNPRK